MRGLTPSQPVVLDLGEEAIDCLVEAVAGDETTLAPVVAADAAYIPSLGRAAALVFAADAGRARVAGAVHRAADAGRLRFVVGAAADLPARRQTARTGVDLPVAVAPMADGGPARRLLTSDISLGGLGIGVDDWAPAVGDVLTVAIEVPGAEAIRGSARVLRVGNGVAGLEFTDIAAAERGRLAAFLIASRATHRL
jgi:PilZ domain-containing protein